MKQEKHLQRASQIEKSLNKLLPDPKGESVAAIVELSYGIAQHLIAAGCDKKFGLHKDSHIGLCRFLRDKDARDVAKIFEDLDKRRQGRWYGGQGNGNVVKECLKVIKQIKQWLNL